MRGKSRSIVFPAARIKRIMRSNEEVGKIAVPTPVLVSKALQMMLQDFLTSCCETARKHKSTVVTPYLMELCMRNYQRFAFLLRLLANKQSLESQCVDSEQQVYSCLEKERTRITKERHFSLKRRCGSDISVRNEEKQPLLLNGTQSHDSKYAKTYNTVIPPLFYLGTEEDNYDFEEDDSRTSNTSCSVNDGLAVDNQNDFNNILSMENKHELQEENMSPQGTHSNVYHSQADEKNILNLAMVENTCLTCSSLSQRSVHDCDRKVAESSYRELISIEDLVHPE